MSSQKGNVRKDGQKHQNKFAFKHNPKSKKTETILALPIHGLCQHCHSVLEWRKQFRKYKPLTAPKKCVSCQQKTVKSAYHVICDNCAKTKGVCAKCLQVKSIVTTEVKTPEQIYKESQEEELMLAGMRERERRAYLRAKERAAKEEGAEGDEENEENEENEDGEEGSDFEEFMKGGDTKSESEDEEDAEDAPIPGFKRLVLKGAPKKAEELPAPVVVKKAPAPAKRVEEKDTKNYYDDDDDDDDDDDENEDEEDEDEEDEDEDEEDEDDEEDEEEEEVKKPEPPRIIKTAKRRL